MDRLLVIYSEQSGHPTLAEIGRNLVLECLKSSRNDVVRWTNPERLEFQVIDMGHLIMRFYAKTGRKKQNAFLFPSILRGDNEGMKFFRKVPNVSNIYRFHFLPRHLLPSIPRKKSFSQLVKLSTETAV